MVSFRKAGRMDLLRGHTHVKRRTLKGARRFPGEWRASRDVRPALEQDVLTCRDVCVFREDCEVGSFWLFYSLPLSLERLPLPFLCSAPFLHLIRIRGDGGSAEMLLWPRALVFDWSCK